MSDNYVVGPNRPITVVNEASFTCAVEYSGTTYVFWRDSLLVGDDPNSVIKCTTSTDGLTWTDPVTVYSEAGKDVYPGGVVHNGTNFRMAVGVKNTVSQAVTTKILSSTTALTWSSPVTPTFTEYWLIPTDLQYVSGTYYLAATTRVVFNGPMLSTVKTSTNLTSWTSLGYPSQSYNAIDNVGARIAVTNGVVDLVHKEGNFVTSAPGDRILHVRYANGSWGLPETVVSGTGFPDIAPLSIGYAVVYKDQSIQHGHGIWSWAYYDGGKFYTRGTFTQDFEFGQGASVLPTSDGFTTYYSTRFDPDGLTAGRLYARHFTDTFSEPAEVFFPYPQGRRSRDQDTLDNFRFEISNGSYWVPVHDGFNYYVAPDDFGEHAQTQRRITASSPFYEGTYLIHSVRENVTEQFTIHILGASQNDVTENILALEELVTQPSFKIRMILGNHAETWSCQSADYSISRGHVYMHSTRAAMRVSVPRLPEVSYEVVQ